MFKKIALICLLSFFLFACEEVEPAGQQSSPLSVHFIDVGQGDATLINYQSDKESHTILYDTGDWLGDEVVPYLRGLNIDKLDVVIISHPHADHIGQLTHVLQAFDVEEVWMSGNTTDTTIFSDALEAVAASGATYVEPRAGEIFDIGPLTLTILHPEKLIGGLNEDSLSIKVDFGKTSFVFTGDALKAEEELIVGSGQDLAADILQVGHHGSNTSSSEVFIDAIGATYAIYSAGYDNKYGHPHQEVVSLFDKKGIPLYGTDTYGTIIATSDGRKVTLDLEEKNGTIPENCIDINHATEKELLGIVHIGEVRVKELMLHRPYTSVTELTKIKGINANNLDDIITENKACIGGNHS